ncbi:hypothetical protein [Desulfovibrio inopinatus]|uniref:hypothetical protein n=1 Tax=Desulfovibrio inopinatus TaxID=102109 RepID=UPI0003FB4299|nr:hypothetical protein [Desulfovibrio inopinatus]
MEMNTIEATVTGLVIAAQTGFIEKATTIAKNLGTAGMEKLYNLVKQRFTKDGEGAVSTLQQLENNPSDEKMQRIVKRRLEGILEEDPTFKNEIKAIIGEIRVDQSINQTATSGDNSPITQIVGSNNQVK